MSHSVLIVDDEPGITAALMVRLQSEGYEVFHAINGLAGLEAARIHKPHVIILDIRMPDIDGFEVCRSLKQDSDLSHIPVIFLSANYEEAARDRAMKVGGSRFLSKPYQASDIISALNDVVIHHAI